MAFLVCSKKTLKNYFFLAEFCWCIFSHYCCELDENCPSLIYLERVENISKISNLKKKSKQINIVKNLDLIDEHFSSYLHFTNFKISRGSRGNSINFRYSVSSQSPDELCLRTQKCVNYLKNKVIMNCVIDRMGIRLIKALVLREETHQI